MNFKTLILLSSATLFLAAAGAQAQDNEPTIRAIPNPDEDLPEAVTKDVPFPDEADDTGETHSADGRSGVHRDDGLDTARAAASNGLATAQENAADAAQDALSDAAEAAAHSREDFGRSHAPDDLPGQVPEDLPGPPPDVPGPPTG